MTKFPPPVDSSQIRAKITELERDERKRLALYRQKQRDAQWERIHKPKINFTVTKTVSKRRSDNPWAESDAERGYIRLKEGEIG